MDTIDPQTRDRTKDHDPAESNEEEPQGPRFPAIILAAPGFILALFAAGADALIKAHGSVHLAITIAIVAGTGAVACFAVVGAKSTERHVHLGAGLAVGATIFALCATILRLT